MKKNLFFVILSLLTMLSTYAQKTSEVQIKVNELVKKYEEVKGVDCTLIEKGRGLGMVKMMFNKQFGKDFMKGVTSITIIDYTDASKEVSETLRKELNVFLSVLKEYNLNKKKEFAEHSYIRSFASSTDDGTISDFVVAIESLGSKMIMYMAGEIKVEK
jgi:hypothetical protein